LVREELELESAAEQLAVAQEHMQERWVMRRHRDIANRMVDEERHAAVANWAERRARVEEEVALNAETMRFQSELWQRGATLPADAEEDIAPTAPPDDGLEESFNFDANSLIKKPIGSKQPGVTVAAPPKYDVSKVSAEIQHVQFSAEAYASPRSKPISEDCPRLDRIANLRRINKNLLQASEAEDVDDGFSDFPAESIFQTEVTTQHISLSAYTPDSTQAAVSFRNKDDADVLAAVCDHWSTRQEHVLGVYVESEVGSGVSMHQMRFKQQQEAEAVKRVMARRNCPFNAAVVDSALVMPSHVITPEACIFNTEPNLRIEGLPSWFVQDRQKKKVVKKPARKGKAKK